jgi:hypothetical protein
MLEYEALKPLFQFLDLLKIFHKQWSGTIGWKIVDCLHKQIEIAMKTTNQVVEYLSITCDEVTAIDTKSWINIHTSGVQDWAKVPIFISLEQVTKGATTSNLTKVVIEAATMKGRLGKDEISTKLMLFGVGMYMMSEFFFFLLQIISF